MLSWSERLILWNQYEILKRLDPASAKEHETSQEIVAQGFEQFYCELNALVEKEPIPFEVTAEVIDILDLFRAIDFSCRHHKYVPQSAYAQFDGFDGNEETEHYAAAKFVRRTWGKWKELSGRPDNSHANVLERYRRMVRKWYEFERERDLSPAQIEEIAESAVPKS